VAGAAGARDRNPKGVMWDRHRASGRTGFGHLVGLTWSKNRSVPGGVLWRRIASPRRDGTRRERRATERCGAAGLWPSGCRRTGGGLRRPFPTAC